MYDLLKFFDDTGVFPESIFLSLKPSLPCVPSQPIPSPPIDYFPLQSQGGVEKDQQAGSRRCDLSSRNILQYMCGPEAADTPSASSDELQGVRSNKGGGTATGYDAEQLRVIVGSNSEVCYTKRKIGKGCRL